MKISERISIKYKLMLVVLLTATIGLTLAASALLSYDHTKQKETLAQEMQILTKVVALRSSAALSFRSSRNALANLNSLLVRSNVRLACMYDEKGEVFVQVKNGSINETCPDQLRDDSQVFVNDHLEVFESISRNGELIGKVFVRSDIKELSIRLMQQILVSVTVLVISLLFAFAITSRMQKQIYGPIVELGKLAREITRNKNYSIRAHAVNNDELGDTVLAFNKMLSEIEADKEQLVQLAYYDPLTRLPNRRMFTERIEFALGNAVRDKDAKVALMFLDLDRFKQVNDLLGHDIGDLLLKEVAHRLELAIPESATAFRLGGDEFTVIQCDIKSVEDVKETADRILKEFEPEVNAGGEVLTISTSIGIAISNGKDTISSVMKTADKALYRAKDDGRGNYKVVE